MYNVNISHIILFLLLFSIIVITSISKNNVDYFSVGSQTRARRRVEPNRRSNRRTNRRTNRETNSGDILLKSEDEFNNYLDTLTDEERDSLIKSTTINNEDAEKIRRAREIRGKNESERTPADDQLLIEVKRITDENWENKSAAKLFTDTFRETKKIKDMKELKENIIAAAVVGGISGGIAYNSLSGEQSNPEPDLIEAVTESLTCTDIIPNIITTDCPFENQLSCLVYEEVDNIDEKQKNIEKMIRGMECKENYKGIISLECEDNQFTPVMCVPNHITNDYNELVDKIKNNKLSDYFFKIPNRRLSGSNNEIVLLNNPNETIESAINRTLFTLPFCYGFTYNTQSSGMDSDNKPLFNMRYVRGIHIEHEPDNNNHNDSASYIIDLDKFNYFDKKYVSINVTYSFSNPIQLTLEEARIIVFQSKNTAIGFRYNIDDEVIVNTNSENITLKLYNIHFIKELDKIERVLLPTFENNTQFEILKQTVNGENIDSFRTLNLDNILFKMIDENQNINTDNTVDIDDVPTSTTTIADDDVPTSTTTIANNDVSLDDTVVAINDVILDLTDSYYEVENTDNYINYDINPNLSTSQLNSNIIEGDFIKVFDIDFYPNRDNFFQENLEIGGITIPLENIHNGKNKLKIINHPENVNIYQKTIDITMDNYGDHSIINMLPGKYMLYCNFNSAFTLYQPFISSTSDGINESYNNIANLNLGDKYKLYSEYIRIRIICNEDTPGIPTPTLRYAKKDIIEGVYKLLEIDDSNNKPVYRKHSQLDDTIIDSDSVEIDPTDTSTTTFWFDNSKCVIGKSLSNISENFSDYYSIKYGNFLKNQTTDKKYIFYHFEDGHCNEIEIEIQPFIYSHNNGGEGPVNQIINRPSLKNKKILTKLINFNNLRCDDNSYRSNLIINNHIIDNIVDYFSYLNLEKYVNNNNIEIKFFSPEPMIFNEGSINRNIFFIELSIHVEPDVKYEYYDEFINILTDTINMSINDYLIDFNNNLVRGLVDLINPSTNNKIIKIIDNNNVVTNIENFDFESFYLNMFSLPTNSEFVELRNNNGIQNRNLYEIYNINNEYYDYIDSNCGEGDYYDYISNSCREILTNYDNGMRGLGAALGGDGRAWLMDDPPVDAPGGTEPFTIGGQNNQSESSNLELIEKLRNAIIYNGILPETTPTLTPIPSGTPSGTSSGTPSGTSSGTSSETPSETPSGTPSGTPNQSGEINIDFLVPEVPEEIVIPTMVPIILDNPVHENAIQIIYYHYSNHEIIKYIDMYKDNIDWEVYNNPGSILGLLLETLENNKNYINNLIKFFVENNNENEIPQNFNIVNDLSTDGLYNIQTYIDLIDNDLNGIISTLKVNMGRNNGIEIINGNKK